MNLKNVLYEKRNEIATITLNRPDVLNALNQPLLNELMTALKDADNDNRVRVAVLSGAGRCFCAGQDLREAEFEDTEKMHKTGSPQLDPFELIETMRKPVIAAVQGYAVTGGFYLACSCDIVVATEDAKFADTHARWGIKPAGAVTQRWSRKAGLMRAKYFMLTSSFLSAHEAERMGLVAKVVPDGKLDEAVKEIVDSILKNSSEVMAHVKTMMNRGFEVDFATATRMEVMAAKWGQANTVLDQEKGERLTAFREKKTKATS